MNYYRNNNPRKAEKPNPFYKLLETEIPINFTSKFGEPFDSVNNVLSDACQLALKQPLPGKQLVLMTDAIFRSAGYALMIEDNPDQKIQSKRKTYAPNVLAQKLSPPRNSKHLNTQKIFGQPTWHLSTSDNFCGKQQSQQLSWQKTSPSHVFSKQRQFRQDFGMHVFKCCNLISK